MKDNDANAERLWSYLHGQLPPGERTDVEKQLKSDPELAKALKDLENLHRDLRALLPLEETSDEVLEENILAQWERQQKLASVEEPAPRKEIRSPLIAWWTRPVLWAPLSAVAAVLLLAVGLQFAMRSPIAFQDLEVVPMQYRGEGGDEGLSREQLLTLREQLQKQVVAAYLEAKGRKETSWFGSHTDWVLGCRMEGIYGGLLVEVNAYKPREDEAFKTWRHEIVEPEQPQPRLVSLGKEIAQELAQLNP